MANEIKVPYGITGRTIYAIARNAAGEPFNIVSGLYEAYTAPNYADYAIALTEQGATGFYIGNIPAAALKECDTLVAYMQSGGSPAPGNLEIAAEDRSLYRTRISVYDSAPLSGSDITLADGSVQSISGTGRVRT